jgi:glucose/mannose transport system substrate-binding protein
MKSKSLAWVVAVACGAGAGCSGSSNEAGTVEVMTWWTEPGEREALNELLVMFEGRYPSQTVSLTEIEGAPAARETITQRVLEGYPPETFQANGGSDLMAWVAYNNNNGGRESKLEALDSNASWVKQMPEPVLDTVRFEGKIYGVPLNIHRLNVLFFNKQVFIDKKLPVPTAATLSTLDDLFALCDTLVTKGVQPLALALEEKPWLALYLFENLLVARAGAAYYRIFFQGQLDAERILDSPYLRDAIGDLARLLSYDRGAHTRTWTEAVDAVVREEAAMTIMGDWAKGYMKRQAPDQHDDFGAIRTPGTGDSFVFTTDTFGLPKGARNRSGALKLLEVFASQAGQDEFNLIKGSIPARSDADSTKFDAISQGAIDDFLRVAEDRVNLVPATSIMAPRDYMDPIDDLLADYAGKNELRPDLAGNASVLLHGLANRYDTLRNTAWRY